jgi:hypothetical protein
MYFDLQQAFSLAAAGEIATLVFHRPILPRSQPSTFRITKVRPQRWLGLSSDGCLLQALAYRTLKRPMGHPECLRCSMRMQRIVQTLFK